MKKDQIGLLIGRFQPPHLGHVFLFKKALDCADKLIVGVGSPDTIDEENFLTFLQRKSMLEKVAGDEGWRKKIIAILPITDYLEDDQLWLEKTLETVEKISKFDIFIGNDPWTSGIFEKNGYKVLRCGFYKRYLYEGEKIRKLMAENKKWEDRIPRYLIAYIKTRKLADSQNKKQFNHIILGGTFDHFHKGHLAFLDLALLKAHKLTIGVVKNKLIEGKFLSGAIEDYKTRKKAVSDYFERRKAQDRVKIISITDIYGTSLTDRSIEAILVTRQTFPGAKKINEERKEKNLRPLKIIVAPFVKDEAGEIISSERIRAGEIDRAGQSYIKIFSGRKLLLPENLREELRKPLGNIVKDEKGVLKIIDDLKPAMVVAVGDIIAMSLVKLKFIPDISVIDFRSRRKDIISREKNFIGIKHVKQMEWLKELIPQNFTHFKNLNNFPGTINTKAVHNLNLIFKKYLETKKKQLMIVNGEEDLLTLPAILLAPLGSLVVYGQWNLGIVAVAVSEKIKADVVSLLARFVVVR